MGLLAGLALTGMMAYGLYAFIFLPDRRAEMIAELRGRPVHTTGVMIMALLCLTFLWGLLIPRFGTIRLGMLGSWRVLLWQASGLMVLAGMFVGGVVTTIWNRRSR